MTNPVQPKYECECKENPLLIQSRWSWEFIIQDCQLCWETYEVWDKYHTLSELYKHRIHLFIALCKNYISCHVTMKEWKAYYAYQAFRSKKHSDWTEYKWWFLLQLFTWEWQISYHLPNQYWNECEFAESLSVAREWDWHTSDDVLDRLLQI